MVNAFSETPSQRGAARADEEKPLYELATGPQPANAGVFVDAYKRQSRGQAPRRQRRKLRRSSVDTSSSSDTVTVTGRITYLPTLPDFSLPRIPVWLGLLAALILMAAAPPALSFAFPAAAESIARMALSFVPEAVFKTVEDNASCAVMTPVVSEDGSLLTYLRKAGCENTTYVTAPVSVKGAMNVAPAFAAVEGDGYGRGILLNISFPGLARAAWHRGAVGGTNFVQSAIESTAGRPQGLRLREKLWLLFGVGTSYTAQRLPTDADRVVFAAQNLQCAVGAAGSSFGPAIAGDLCASLVGKDHYEDLSPAETCVIASTFVSPLRIPGIDQDPQDFLDQFEKIKTRAVTKCAAKVTSVGAKSIETEIKSIKAPTPATLFALTGRSEDALPFAGRLFEEFGVKQDGSRLVTTLNPAAQRALVARAVAFGDKNVREFNPALCWSDTCGNNRVDIALAAFEVKAGVPRLLAGYESRRELLAGPKDGRPHRSVGSLSKGVMVPLLVEAGIDKLCRSPWANLHDADGFAGRVCGIDGGYMSVDEALARSSNLAIADGLRKVDETVLRTHLAFTGYTIHADLNHQQLIRSLITGDNVAIAPLPLVRDYAGLLFAPVGATSPIIAGVGDAATSIAFAPRFNDSIRRRSRSILAAPLFSEHATLRGTKVALEAAGCKEIFGKSGTTDSTVPADYRDKLVIVGGRCNGRDIIAFALVGSPDIQLPVGQVTTHQVASLATDAIAFAIKNGGK